MPDPSDRLTAALAGSYAIRRELGHGGMATVYLAHDLRHDRQVALKVLRQEQASTLGPGRFLREIAVTGRLDHPGIVPLLDSGNADGYLFYVMPYVEGESLRTRLLRERQLPVPDAVRIAREVADALAYAHAHGVVHRDIKPENILLSAEHARVADFGISRAVRAAGTEPLTESGLIIGTLAYMSPEQFAGGADVDGRSDIYSLGCVAYEMLIGEPPFNATQPQVLFAQKCADKPREIRLIRPAVPPHVERAVLTALAPMPADRYQTAAEFVRTLEEASPSATRHAVVAKLPRLRLLVPLALVALATVLGTVWNARSDDTDSRPPVHASRIAVFPFLVEDARAAELREGIMDLLSSTIDGAGEIRRVDPLTLMRRFREAGESERTDLRSVGRISHDLGAGRFVMGRVVSAGGRVQILASLYAGERPTEPEMRFSREGSADSTIAIVGALASAIILHVQGGPGTWATKEHVGSSTSAHALREYSRGESLLRRSQQDSAATAFRNALSVDSSFALAWLRLAVAEDFRLSERGMVIAIDRARQFGDRLSPRDRLLANVLHASYHGDGARAERAAAELVGSYPAYGEGWYQLGATQLWYAWQRGRSPLYAKHALEKALAVDPEHRQALNLTSWIASLEANFVRAESLEVRAWGRRWSLPPPDERDFAAFIADSATWPTSKIIQLTYSTAGRTDRLIAAGRIAGLLAERDSEPSELSSFGHLLFGLVQAAGGRWEPADQALTRADAAGDGVGVLERAWLAAMPFLSVEDSVRRSLREDIRGWEPPTAYLERPRDREIGRFPFIGLLVMPPWLAPHARIYVLGLLSASLADGPAASRYARELHTAAEPSDSIGLLADLAIEIRALLAMQQGDTVAALTILEQAGMRVASRYQVLESPFHTRPLARFLRAEALAATGRAHDAIGWYARLPWLDASFPMFAWTCVRQGQLYDQLGDARQATHHYRRFVARWRHADARHQPLVRDIDRRLRELERAG